MKYNVGDKVRIKSLDWYNENKGNADKTNSVWCKDGGAWFFYHMSQHCGEIMTIKNVWVNSYTLAGSDSRWTDEMIECLVEEEFEVDLIPKFGEYSDNEPLDVPTMTTDFVKEHGLPCPEGYQFVDENGNVINATKIVLEKKKKEYPKTYEECCEVLGIEGNSLLINTKHITDYERDLGNLMGQLHRLIICRDAYWKIAGEEMGLGKPWKPDWKSLDPQYIILYQYGSIDKAETHGEGNYILTFPTAEMRDAFYENFKPGIEICK